MKRETYLTTAQVVAGIIVCAALLAMRDAFDSGLIRAVMSAVALSILGLALAIARRRPH